LLSVTVSLNDAPTTDIYTLSLHDALPISLIRIVPSKGATQRLTTACRESAPGSPPVAVRWAKPATGSGNLKPTCHISLKAGKTRSEEHTSELQSRSDLVCRLLLEKKKQHI